MTRTLYLHIGSHKTGTTSIQKYLAQNRDALLKHGYFYPVSSTHVNLGSVLGRTNFPDEMDTEAEASRFQRIKQVAKLITEQNSPHVIASTEGFSYLFDRPVIEAYHRLLAPEFSTIKVITYLRRQDLFAISHHQEGAKPQDKPAAKLHGHSPTALPEKGDLQHKYLDYEARIGLWADIFGDDAMVVRVYDRKALKNGDSIADFLDIVGLADFEGPGADDKNVSMGFMQSKIGHILNDVITDQHLKASVLNRLPDTDRLLPRRDDARKFLAPYVDGNRRLNARFKINDLPNLFSDDFSMFPESGNELWTEPTAEAAIRACAEVIELLSMQSVHLAPNDYLAAAKALQSTLPEIAGKFLIAAQQMRPQSERIKRKIERMANVSSIAQVAVKTVNVPVKPGPAQRKVGKSRTRLNSL